MSHETLSQQIYSQLRIKLRSGDLRPGERLVNRTLAKEFGTSTIPLREAINRLVSDGLLHSVPGGGAYVRSPDAAELEELYDVREAIESLAAAEAARFANDNLVADLKSIGEESRAIARGIPRHGTIVAEKLPGWIDSEVRFHARIVEASRNRWLVKVAGDLCLVSQVFAAHRSATGFVTRTIAEQVAVNHLEFVTILAQRDVEAARTWMAAHIRAGRDEVLAFLRRSTTVRSSRP